MLSDGGRKYRASSLEVTRCGKASVGVANGLPPFGFVDAKNTLVLLKHRYRQTEDPIRLLTEPSHYVPKAGLGGPRQAPFNPQTGQLRAFLKRLREDMLLRYQDGAVHGAVLG